MHCCEDVQSRSLRKANDYGLLCRFEMTHFQFYPGVFAFVLDFGKYGRLYPYYYVCIVRARISPDLVCKL